MPFFELFDETLDINSTGNYELSLEVSPARLTFCLLDAIRNKFIMLREYSPEKNNGFSAEEVKDVLLKDDFLARNYRRTVLILPSPRYTLIPAPLYDPARKDDYFSFNHVRWESEIIQTNRIPDPDAFLIFSTGKEILEILKGIYPGSFPLHQMKPLLHHVAAAGKSLEKPFIHAHIENDFFNLLVSREKTLQFSNTFLYRNITDVLYFILNVIRNIDLRKDNTIFLSGQTEIFDELYSGLRTYIKDIKFAEPSGNFTFSYVFNDLQLHRYLNLISAINCA